MVNNKMKILDEGKNKFVPECIEMKKPEYVYQFETELKQMELLYRKKESAGREYQEKIIKFHECNCIREKRNYENYCREWKRTYEDNPEKEYLLKFLFDREINNPYEFNRIAKYYNIIPFTPSVMINISPDWNGEGVDRRSTQCKIQILKNLIDSYMKEGWYEQWNYVIECGCDGEHIHAHIVAKMNTQRLKSTESHLKRGNQTQQLKKYAKKVKGMAGIIKGVSVQKTFLRTEELVKDKLDYLIEDKKPLGHKNKFVIPDGYISGEL